MLHHFSHRARKPETRPSKRSRDHHQRMEALERRTLLSAAAAGALAGLASPPPPDLIAEHGEQHHDHHHGGGEPCPHDYDEFAGGGDQVDYVLNNKWGFTNLTYGYSNLFAALNSTMADATIRDSIEEGLLLWTAVSPLTFTEMIDPGGAVNDNAHLVQAPHIRIGAHNIDGNPPGGDVLAHAQPPGAGLGGDLHFDSANPYNNPAALTEVTAHEIGHSIGIAHANGNVVNGNCPAPKPAIMDACIQNRFANPGDGFLFTDDVLAVRAHYGSGLGWVLDRFGTLYVSGTQADNTFYVSADGNNLTVQSVGNGSFTRSMSGVNSVVIHGRGGNDDIFVQSVPASVELIVEGEGGDDDIHIGNGDYDNNVLGSLIVAGGDGNDTAVINDLTDGAGGDVYNFDFNWFEKGAAAGRTSFHNPTLEQVTLIGSGNSDTFHVNSVPVGLKYNLLGNAGNDAFFVGNEDYDFWIGDDVTLSGGAGEDWVVVEDRGDGGNDTHVLTANTYRKTNSSDWVTYSAVEVFLLYAADNDVDNLFQVHGASNGLNLVINAAGGSDTYNIGNLDWDTNLPNARVSVISDGGATLNLMDATDTGNSDVYTINGDEIVKTGGGQTQEINMTGVSELFISASAGGTEIIANQIDQLTTILGNGGDDIIRLYDSHTVNIPFPISFSTMVDAGPGNDSVWVGGGANFAAATFLTSQTLADLVIAGNGSVTLPEGENIVVAVNAMPISGSLNVNDNTVIARGDGTPGNLSYYGARLANGYNNGNWFGASPAIRSLTANGENHTGIGYAVAGDIGMTSVPSDQGNVAVNPDDLVIRYTLYGDATLDRVVNLLDFNRLAANFGSNNTRWSQANFNYDTTTNLLDFNRLAANFGMSAAPAAAAASASASFTGGSSPEERERLLDQLPDFDVTT